MTQDITVIGAGGFGRETLDVIHAVEAERPGTYRLLGVVDEAPSDLALASLEAGGVEWLGSLDDWLASRPRSSFVLAIGSPTVRARLARRIEAAGPRASSVVHPRATIGTQTIVGPGSVVCAGVQISTGVTLGRHVHVNPNGTIGHNASLADHVSINPGAVISGCVTIEDRVLVGAGAVVLQGLTLGHDSVVGAAGCVTHDVAPDTTVVGVPARERERSTT
jgi:sugar O-acyltransferase (sialic acid O-acetyltransferase NeuD family)